MRQHGPITRYKVRTIMLNGVPVQYTSLHTQASFRYLEEGEAEAKPTIQYPPTCETSAYKFKREEMPQIDTKKLIEALRERGIVIENFSMKPSSLSPMQSEFSEDKVHDIIANPTDDA